MYFGIAHPSNEWLRRADAVARVADLWVRRRALVSLCKGMSTSEDADRGYAGGLIEGLADSMGLNKQEYQMAAYTFCLLSGNEAETLSAAEALLDVASDTAVSNSYLDGLAEAQSLYLRAHLADMPRDQEDMPESQMRKYLD